MVAMEALKNLILQNQSHVILIRIAMVTEPVIAVMNVFVKMAGVVQTAIKKL